MSLGLGMFLIAFRAQGFELDSVLPPDVPGYGAPFRVTAGHAARDIPGWQWDGLIVSPGIDFGTGYDSAPNGGGGSFMLNEAPHLIITDTDLGFGAFFGGMAAQYPQDPAQNVADDALAVGERAVLPGQTISLAAAYLTGQETGFDPGAALFKKPPTFAVTNLRSSDEIALGELTLKPDITVSDSTFPSARDLDGTAFTEALSAGFSTGGPGNVLVLLRATQSRDATPRFNVGTAAAFIGISDNAPELWDIRLLAGAARRGAASGGDITAPVLEASVDWQPDFADRVRVQLTREIDDPDEVAATPYILTEAKLSISHDLMHNLTIKVSSDVQDDALFNFGGHETIFNADGEADWQLNDELALRAGATFNDRQASNLRAANETVFTLGFTWTL